MITVLLLRDARHSIRAFELRGHAEYAGHGRDIVCAAVSAVTQSAVLGVRQLDGRVAYRSREGRLCCVLPRMGQRNRRQADAILETMRLGLLSIRKGRAQYLRIIEKEVDDYVFHELAAFCPQKRYGQFTKRPRQRI